MALNIIIAQGLALLGLAGNMISVQCKRRLNVLIFQIAANLLYGVQYIFLGAWSALAVCLISAIECIVVYYYANRGRVGSDKDNKNSEPIINSKTADTSQDAKMPWPVLAVIIIATTLAGLISFDGDLFSIIPIIVTIAYSWSIWQPNLRIFRIIAVIIPASWFIYNWHVSAFVSVATAVVEFINAITAVIRLDICYNSRNHDK